MKIFYPFRTFRQETYLYFDRKHRSVQRIDHRLYTVNFAFASKSSDFIQIDTIDKAEAVLDDQELKQLTAVIKMSPSLHALQFAPGDFVALQGFRHESNKGVFQVLKTIGDNSFEIGNVDLGSSGRGSR